MMEDELESPRSAIQVAGQVWKIRFFDGLLVASGIGIFLGETVESFGLRYTLLGTLVGIISFIGVCMFVRCPRCSAAWYWMAVSEQPVGSWQGWLNNLSECPHCGYPNEVGHFNV